MNMDSSWMATLRSFFQLPAEQQFVLALAALSCLVVTIWAVSFAARQLRPRRIHERRPVNRPVVISWKDGLGLRQSGDGICKDISQGGVGLTLSSRVGIRTYLSFQVPEAKLSGAGVVCRCTRVGPEYQVGVKFDRLMGAAMSRKLQGA